MDALTAFVMNRLLKSTRGAARVEGGRRVLTANLGVKLIAVLFPALLLGIVYAMIASGQAEQPLFVYGIAGGFLLLSGAMVYMVLLTRLAFDDHYIHFSSPLYRDRQIPWTSVTRGWYSAALTTYYVDTKEIGKIRISPMQHGWGDFLRMAGRKLQENTGEDPFAALLPEG